MVTTCGSYSFLIYDKSNDDISIKVELSEVKLYSVSLKDVIEYLEINGIKIIDNISDKYIHCFKLQDDENNIKYQIGIDIYNNSYILLKKEKNEND